MWTLIHDTFPWHKDQLQVDELVLQELSRRCDHFVYEETNADGPYLWLLLFTCSADRSEAFVSKKISEQELFADPGSKDQHEILYLCSITLLPEFRGRNTAFGAVEKCIQSISLRFPIKKLMVWPWTDAGLGLAQKLSIKCQLPLLLRPKD